MPKTKTQEFHSEIRITPSNSTEFEPYTITTDITRYSSEIPYSPYWTDESDTPKEEDEEDIDYLYRVGGVGGCTKTIEVEKIVEVPQKTDSKGIIPP